jgi:hypothetical protein
VGVMITIWALAGSMMCVFAYELYVCMHVCNCIWALAGRLMCVCMYVCEIE